VAVNDGEGVDKHTIIAPSSLQQSASVTSPCEVSTGCKARGMSGHRSNRRTPMNPQERDRGVWVSVGE
jgi:hypothetical protein